MNPLRSGSAPDPRRGCLPDLIVHFARTLRRAGMRVGTAAARDAVEAVIAAGIGRRGDFYWALHAVLVNRHEDHATFDAAFRMFWQMEPGAEGLLAVPMQPQPRPPAESRALAATGQAGQGREAGPGTRETVNGYAAGEALRQKDFAQMSAAELNEARAAIAALRFPGDKRRTRRMRPDSRGRRPDPRAMMRQALRSGGDFIPPRFRTQKTMPPPLVAIADISGSMSQYTRIFLHFLHGLMESRRRVGAFVFATRLTNLTRQLRHRDPDEAVAEAARAVLDWDGGTRIGMALHAFNREWSRRVLAQGATVLLVTDGLERDDLDRLRREMERLRKSCRRLIWLNPLLRFEGFEARAGGVRTILPHVDEFRPVHSLNALADLVRALSADRQQAQTGLRHGMMRRNGGSHEGSRISG